MGSSSPLGGAVTLYELSSEVIKVGIRHGQQVQHGRYEMRLFMETMSQFQACVARLAQPSMNEDSKSTDESRLRFLRQNVGQSSRSYRELVRELQDVLEQLDARFASNQITRQAPDLAWPLKADDRQRVVKHLYVMEAAIAKFVDLDSNDLVHEIDSLLTSRNTESCKDSHTFREDGSLSQGGGEHDRAAREDIITSSEQDKDATSELRWLDQRFKSGTDTSLESDDLERKRSISSKANQPALGRISPHSSLARTNTFSSSEYSQDSPKQSHFNGLNEVAELSDSKSSQKIPSAAQYSSQDLPNTTKQYAPFRPREQPLPSEGSHDHETMSNAYYGSEADHARTHPRKMIASESLQGAATGGRESQFSYQSAHQAKTDDSHKENSRANDPAIPSGLLIGNGMCCAPDLPPKPPAKEPHLQANPANSKSSASGPSKGNNVAGSIPTGLLPGRPSSRNALQVHAERSTPAHAWENRSYSRTSTLPIAPRKTSMPTGYSGPEHSGYDRQSSSSSRLGPILATAPAWQNDMSAELSSALERTGSSGPEQMRAPLHPPYAHHQHTRSLPQSQLLSLGDVEARETPEHSRQGHQDVSVSALTVPPPYASNSYRYSVSPPHTASKPSPAPSSSQPSPYTPGFGSNSSASSPSMLPQSLTSGTPSAPRAGSFPMSTTPPTAHSVPSTSPSHEKRAPDSSDQLTSMQLPGALSLGFGKNMHPTTAALPHHYSYATPIAERQEQAVKRAVVTINPPPGTTMPQSLRPGPRSGAGRSPERSAGFNVANSQPEDKSRWKWSRTDREKVYGYDQ